MYTAILENGDMINNDTCAWHDMPQDVRIKSFGVAISVQRPDDVPVGVADDFFSGFEQYGFQMSRSVGFGEGDPPQDAVQLICIAGEHALVTDIALLTGIRRSVWQPLAKLTYKRELLRKGIP